MMKQVNSIKILKLTVEGFKAYKEEITFEFGDMTMIIGSPRKGKSSIATAIAYAFTGTSYIGGNGLDRLMNENSDAMNVSVEFLDGEGEIHNLTRSRKNEVTTISFDNYNVRQTDINGMFGDKHLFLSIFNPQYFIDILGTEGREMLEKMLPLVKHSDILVALPEPTKSRLEKESLLSPETYIKNRREEIKELEESLIYTQGQSDLQNTDAKKAIEGIAGTTEALALVEADLSPLELELEKGKLTHEEIENMTELYRRLDELLADKTDTSDLDAHFKLICKEESKLKQFETTTWQSSRTEEISEKNAELAVLLNKYNSINNMIKNIQPGYKCPTCFHEITERNIENATNSSVKELTKCVENGKATQKIYNELIGADNSDKKAFDEKICKDIYNAQAVIEELKIKHHLLKMQSDDAESQRIFNTKSIKNQISELEYKKENGSLPPEDLQRLDQLRARKQECLVKLSMYQEIIDKPTLSEDIALIQNEITHLKSMIGDAVLYIGKKYELLFKHLNMSRVKFQLIDIVKSTGEIKDAFKFTYDGHEYSKLSNSEKVLCGLYVSELLKQLSKRNYPTFVDNWESVCVTENFRPQGQLILSKVELGKPLTVIKNDNDIREAA